MTTRQFPLGQILSITTGKLLCDIGGVYEILNFMTDDTLFTHALPRASRECAPHLLRQHPQLEGISVEGITRENWQKRLAELEAVYGATLPVTRLDPGGHEVKDPLTELRDMGVPDEKVIVLETDS